MDGIIQGNIDEEVRQVCAIAGSRRLPRILDSFTVEAGESWFGDPVTYVWVKQSHNNRPTEDEMAELNDFIMQVKVAARDVVNGRPVFFRFLPASSN